MTGSLITCLIQCQTFRTSPRAGAGGCAVAGSLHCGRPRGAVDGGEGAFLGKYGKPSGLPFYSDNRVTVAYDQTEGFLSGATCFTLSLSIRGFLWAQHFRLSFRNSKLKNKRPAMTAGFVQKCKPAVMIPGPACLMMRPWRVLVKNLLPKWQIRKKRLLGRVVVTFK